MMMMMMCADDDDEWTEVSTSQLQHTDAVTTHADTEAEVQHSQGVVKSSDNSETLSCHMSSGPAAVVTSPASLSSRCNDTPDSQQTPATAAAELCSNETAADSLLTSTEHSVVVTSTDHDSVASSLSSDHTKSDSVVVVAATPERTSPSDESSNAKGFFASLSFHIPCMIFVHLDELTGLRPVQYVEYLSRHRMTVKPSSSAVFKVTLL